MHLSRRDVLKLGAGTAALWATGLRTLPALAAAKKIPLALQLYSVRGLCGQDLPGTLAVVAKIGYQGVEFAGYYNRSAKELRKMLDDNGLKCCGTHTGLNTLQGDVLKRTIEFNQTLGNENLVVPGLPHKFFESAAAVQATARLFTELAAQAKPQGMFVGYHAHGGDFKKIDGQTTWDLLFTSAGPDVIMQLDTGNCLAGGGDPIAVLKKFPGRARTIHIKEHGGKKGAAVGEGVVKWQDVFRLCESAGGTHWYIVEQEAYAGGPLESVKQCFENLRKMGKA